MRYALFGGDVFYPDGGWNDLVREFATLKQATEEARRRRFDWWHVVDIEKRVIVRASEED